ncbi:phosphoenolpyruvate--protein phosphotransferase [Ferrimonas pelagia]|uniref:Phosphoenolpyruvate--protein phosphotransferase n=1 Tax=Ferrimonas pelagia TaxID=1177826 RepID=A0ABP9EVZ3_9GAMM
MSKVFSATPISPGMAMGQLLPCQFQTVASPALSPEQLLKQESNALAQLLSHDGLTPSQHQLLQADHLLLADPELLQELLQQLQQTPSLSDAITALFGQHARSLSDLDDPQMAKRANDVVQLGQRLARRSRGESLQLPSILTEPTILLVPDLTAAEFIQLPKHHLVALILGHGTATDHLAILLRSAGLPGLVMTDPCSRLTPGPALLDGDRGQLILASTPHDQHLFAQGLQHWQQRQHAFNALRSEPAQTADGLAIWLGANISSDEEAEQVAQNHLDGVGLLRSEFLYMAEGGWPSEERQFTLYQAIAQTLAGKPLVIRSFDFGADKNLPGLAQHEPNPALGIRAIRLGLQQPLRLRQQFAAVVRLACDYPVKLLLPMISLTEELIQLRELLEQVKQELELWPPLDVGIMIETPAAAMGLDLLAPYLDFASIGSNDLAQYCLAADRLNPRVSPQYPALSVPVLRLINHICQQATRCQLPLSFCGDLANDPRAIPLLLAMGIRQLSIPASRSGPIKYHIRQYQEAPGQSLLTQALSCSRTDQLHSLLNDCVNAGSSATIEQSPTHK